jgi:uncharacterized membrane protein
MNSVEREVFIATGLRKERIEALHDGIYAVAMTLLVLDVRVPHGATTFAQFVQQLHSESAQFGAAAIAFSVVGLMWLNNYYRSSMIVRVDFIHLALTLAASGMIVLVPFSTRALAEYWVYPWGVALFSWNIFLAIVLYVSAAHHYVRFLIPKQVDQGFLRQNLGFMWAFALVAGVVVPALAFVSSLAAVILIPVMGVVNIIAMIRMQPRFVAAHRVALLHAETTCDYRQIKSPDPQRC